MEQDKHKYSGNWKALFRSHNGPLNILTACMFAAELTVSAFMTLMFDA